MQNILFLYLLCILAVFSCKNIECTSPNLDKVFNSTAIVELGILEQVFSEFLSKRYNCNDHSCYEFLLNDLQDKETSGGSPSVYIPIDYINQIKQKVDADLIRNIWLNGLNGVFPNQLNVDGKYILYLKHLSESESIVNDYYLAYKSQKDYSPSLIAASIHTFKDLDFSNCEHRLFVAIHFISVRARK